MSKKTAYKRRDGRWECRISMGKDENGRMRRRYRLHSDKPLSIETALTYDIDCPHCGARLRQVGRCLNAHDLGLYACPACDKR